MRQLKAMLAALDPVGVLVGAEVVPAQRADDGLYVPLIHRLRTTLAETVLLHIGDCKMAALTTLAYLQATRNYYLYLMPLAQVGHVPDQVADWVADTLAGRVKLTAVVAADGQTVVGEGYELTRRLTRETSTGQTVRWGERVLIVRSVAFAAIGSKPTAALGEARKAGFSGIRQPFASPARPACLGGPRNGGLPTQPSQRKPYAKHMPGQPSRGPFRASV